MQTPFLDVSFSSRQSSRESLAPILPIPQPDFSTEPIDPDEPTYCLCQQVSFGEMIGCDNDDVSQTVAYIRAVNETPVIINHVQSVQNLKLGSSINRLITRFSPPQIHQSLLYISVHQNLALCCSFPNSVR